jgi:type 1 glutamine amidotransferase
VKPEHRPRALIVRGGWSGHQPSETTDLVIPFLEKHGYEIQIETTPAVYADPDAMAHTHLIVQSVTMSEASHDQIAGLAAAITAGTGLVGWHGGIVDSYRNSAEYLHLVGGQFAAHPSRTSPAEGTTDINDRHYEVNITDIGREHPLTEGLHDFELTTEQYWVLTDDLNDVLATTTHPAEPGQPWHRPVTSPAVWTRQWGRGRIVVVTPGHSVDVLEHATVRTILERGMLWATRAE